MMERTDLFPSLYPSTIFRFNCQHADHYRYMGVLGVINAS